MSFFFDFGWIWGNSLENAWNFPCENKRYDPQTDFSFSTVKTFRVLIFYSLMLWNLKSICQSITFSAWNCPDFSNRVSRSYSDFQKVYISSILSIGTSSVIMKSGSKCPVTVYFLFLCFDTAFQIFKAIWSWNFWNLSLHYWCPSRTSCFCLMCSFSPFFSPYLTCIFQNWQYF